MMRPVLGPLFAALVVGQTPPILIDPRGAWLEAKNGPPLKKAETYLLVGDSEGALEAIAAADAGPRRWRIEADAHVRAGRTGAALTALRQLEGAPGWQNHALRARSLMKPRPLAPQIGVALFALSSAVLLLGGARELLRLRRETIVTLVLATAALGIARTLAQRHAVAIGVLGIVIAALSHALAATVARTAPGARARMMLLAVFLLGVGGAAFSVGSEAFLDG